MHHRLGSTLVSLVRDRSPLIQLHKWNIRGAILPLAPPSCFLKNPNFEEYGKKRP